MNHAFLSQLAMQAQASCFGTAVVGFAPRSMRAFPMTRVDRPGVALLPNERAVFDIALGPRAVLPRSFWWPVGTTLYSLQINDAEPITVRRSHFQEPGWYGFKLPRSVLRAGSRLRVVARVNNNSRASFTPEIDADILP